MTMFPEAVHRLANALTLIGAALFFPSLLLTGYWSFDRHAPFELLDYKAGRGKPGDTIVIYGNVRRDVERHCSVTYSRHFYDSTGASYELTQGPQLMSSAALDELNRINPDTIRLAIQIPKAAAPGRGKVLVSLEYTCNAVHKLWPIEVLTTMDVEVDPP